MHGFLKPYFICCYGNQRGGFMLIRQLDNWVRRAVDASRVQMDERAVVQENYMGQERRQGEDRRQGLERRQESRYGVEAKDRRDDVDRRSAEVQVNAIN